MKRSIAVGALGVVWGLGCSDMGPAPQRRAERTQSTTAPIQGGSEDTTHSFAVGILVELNPSAGEVAFCSGALLAPNLVATARHCAASISASQIDCATATFGADLASTDIFVTTDPTLAQKSKFVPVAKVVTPGSAATTVCGNDLALLILQKSVSLPEYVTPVLSPSMSDGSLYSTHVTAIGYGVDTPTDTSGDSAGVRRIRENVALQCVPGDSAFPNCLVSLKGQMTEGEFYSGDGTCQGDSGSSAYEQNSFDDGSWVSFGVLSRGGISADGKTCQGGIYTRFDAWTHLIQQTAKEAATMGGYPAPAWATSDLSNPGGGGPDAGMPGSGCREDTDCVVGRCVSEDGKAFVCAQACGTDGSCPLGTSCWGGAGDHYCMADGRSSADPKASSGCAAAPAGDRSSRGPWGRVVMGLGLAAIAASRGRAGGRRRRKHG